MTDFGFLKKNNLYTKIQRLPDWAKKAKEGYPYWMVCGPDRHFCGLVGRFLSALRADTSAPPIIVTDRPTLMLPHAQVIHCLRDCQDLADEVIARVQADAPGPPGKGPRIALMRMFLKTHQRLINQMRALKVSPLQVPFDDFHSHPVAVGYQMASVLNFQPRAMQDALNQIDRFNGSNSNRRGTLVRS